MKELYKPKPGNTCIHGLVRIEEAGLYEVTQDFVTLVQGMHNEVVTKTLVGKGYRFNFLDMHGFGDWAGVLPFYKAESYFKRVSDCIPAINIDRSNKARKVFFQETYSRYKV